jgi:hypothetical protein
VAFLIFFHLINTLFIISIIYILHFLLFNRLYHISPLIYLFIMSDAVRYIHTQAQAQTELERMRAINRMLYAHRRQRMREDPEYEAENYSKQKTKSHRR